MDTGVAAESDTLHASRVPGAIDTFFEDAYVSFRDPLFHYLRRLVIEGEITASPLGCSESLAAKPSMRHDVAGYIAHLSSLDPSNIHSASMGGLSWSSCEPRRAASWPNTSASCLRCYESALPCDTALASARARSVR